MKREVLMIVLLIFLMLAGISRAGNLPPHAVDLGYGMWTCERGYVLRNHACISDAEAGSGPRVIISDMPSAGDGASSPEEASKAATPAAKPSPSLFISTGRPGPSNLPDTSSLPQAPAPPAMRAPRR